MILFLFFFALVATLFAGWRAWRRIRFFLHVFQLESYKPVRYINWIKGRGKSRLVRVSHLLALPLLAGAWFIHQQTQVVWPIGVIVFLWGILFASSREYQGQKQKKPIAITHRMKRLMGTALAIGAIPVLAGLLYGLSTGSATGFLYYLAGLFAADFGAPLAVLLAAWLMQPVEKSIQNGFKKQARSKLKERPDLITIGITGSYGKTSVKFILAEILRQRFNVLATPGSYNTPMGICIVVNNKLKTEHQVLVLEMGMRYRGDIKELCDIAKPALALVTDVGVAHLETMGSIENIAQEKGDILKYMRDDGEAILNIDNPYVADMASRAPGKVWRVSITDHPDADIKARNIKYSPEGASFEVEDEQGNTQLFKTKLLGRHNVSNILLGVAVGRQMGLRLRQIAHGVGRVEPVEHRLQLMKKGAITVIDDAFNSNPVGAHNAVEVLGAFESGRRVIVTPGMVELGDRQWEENRLLGAHMANHVDLAVLIGEKQTAPIVEGLRSGDFPEAKTKVFASFFDAQNFLQGYLESGDVVLYENDLPDQYNE
ncbi:MAG: Mur ligase family protein [Rhodothermales bacterium]